MDINCAASGLWQGARLPVAPWVAQPAPSLPPGCFDASNSKLAALGLPVICRAVKAPNVGMSKSAKVVILSGAGVAFSMMMKILVENG